MVWVDGSNGPRIRLTIYLFVLVRYVTSTSQAKILILDVGSNDQAWGADKGEFLQYYQAFLVRLRDSYPNTLKRIHVIVGTDFWPEYACNSHVFLQSSFGLFKDPSEPKKRLVVFEPDVQHMVEALAMTWQESDPDGVKLFHIDTDGWIDKSLTCDGLHPTTEGMIQITVSAEFCQHHTGHEKISARLVEYLDARGLV